MSSPKAGDLVWGLCLGIVVALLALPATREVFLALTGAHPYAMGFIKFAVLATMGDLLSIRILSGGWKRPKGMLVKAVVWGFVGMAIVLMFGIFASGVAGAAAAGLLPAGRGTFGRVLRAFLTSLTMNFTFAPAFMAAHRLSDTYIDLRVDGGKPSLDELLRAVDWRGFVRFVLLVTIPAFWVPAHTVTFLLSPGFRVVAATLLSIALGVLLSFSRRRTVQPRLQGRQAA
jgi:hypothetical protein